MLADYAIGRADRNLKWGSDVPRAVRTGRLAAACGLGERCAVQGAWTRGRAWVFTAPRGAWECPYTAHVRILSGFVAPDGLSRRLGAHYGSFYANRT